MVSSILKLSSVVTIVLVFLGCSSTISVKMMVPARYNVRGIRKLAVLDFEVSGDVSSFVGNRHIKTRSQFSGATVSSKISSELVKNGFFTVVERAQITRVFAEQQLQMSGVVREDDAQSAGQLLGVEGLIWGQFQTHTEQRAWDTIETRTRIVKKKVNGEMQNVKVKQRVKVFKMSRKLSANLSCKLTDVRTGEILVADEFRSMKRSEVSAPTAVKARAKILSESALANAALNDCSKRLVKALAPHQVWRKREIEKGDGNRMKTALQYAEKGMWEDAFGIWQGVRKNTPDKEEKNYVHSTANLALYYEVQGDLEKAKELYKESFEVSGKKKYLNARQRVITRQKELQVLEAQMQESN